MAISRTSPFAEVEIGKRKGVVGLQDAAILFSVLDHMKTASESERCALISNDDVFHKSETRKLLDLNGIKLQTFKNVSDLFDDLYDHVWEATRTAWHAEMQQIEASLKAQKEELAMQIFPLLTLSEVGESSWKRAKKITGFTVIEFRNVLTELPESEHRPPRATTYMRPDGSEIKISARASVQIEAIVETTNWSGLVAALEATLEQQGIAEFQGINPQPAPEAKTENAAFHESLNVSLTGTVRDGAIGDFTVTGVEISRT